MLEMFAEGLSLLEFQLIRLKKAFPFAPIVVATSTAAADEPIEQLALKNGIRCYRGEEQNVLGRFVNCCRHFHFTDYIIRICGDNPFLQMEFLEKLLEEAQTAGTAGAGREDYISYSVNQKPAILTHFGFFAELVKVDALERVHEIASAPHYREHVTNYIYMRGGFGIRWLEFDPLLSFADSIRLTVDSKEDFENAVAVYGALKELAGVGIVETGAGEAGAGVPEADLSWRNILAVIGEHPEIRVNMEKQIRLHQK